MEKENDVMIENEMLEQTNETENTDTQTVEQNAEETNNQELEKEERKSFRDILKENPEYKEEMNSIVKERVARAENRVKREYDNKYSHMENVVKVGMETETAEEAIEKMADYYISKGKSIPTESKYSDSDLQLLAKAEADSITDFDELVDEVDRLAEKGLDNLSPREKLVFKNLAERRQAQERKSELEKVGAKKEILDSEEFKAYAKDFKEDVPVSRIYENYLKQMPTPEAESIGSMKNNNSKEEKTYYTPEEVDKLNSKDLDNPVVMKNVRESMKKWKK